MDAALMLSLMERLSSLTAPSRTHPDALLIDERADAWGREESLISGDQGGTPLGRAGLGLLAARLLPEAATDRVTLFTRWLLWTFALDDIVDDSPLGGSATAVHSLYTDLLKAVRRGHARPDARPLEVALVGLWAETAPLMTPDRRRRFMASLEEHRTACAEEAVNRRTGQLPGADYYPALRRRAAAPFLLDLAEPALDLELPGRIRGTHCWQSLIQATCDLIAWSNDVASYRKESARGDVHNYLTVVSAAYGLRPSQAIAWLNDEITLRVGQCRSAMQALPAEMTRLELDPAARRAVVIFAEHLLAAPRAHLDWLLETGRYEDDGSGPGPLAEQQAEHQACDDLPSALARGVHEARLNGRRDHHSRSRR